MSIIKKATKGFTGILDFGEQNEEKTRETEETIEERVMNFGKDTKPTVEVARETYSTQEEEMFQNDAIINKNPRLRIYKPTYYEVVQSIGKDIVDGKIVLLDLSSLDERTTMKIVQFVYGICFARGIEPEDVSQVGS